MSGGGQQSTVSQQTVPDWLKPYYTQALQPALNLSQGPGPEYYPGQTVAPLNPVQEQGIQSTVNAASGPNASQGAQAMNRFETSGALMNPAMNPYLQGTFTQGANAVQNQLSSEFAGSGRDVLGSLPIQSDEMNNLATQLYGGAYNTGLQTTTQATALAPLIDQGTYLPGQELMQTGAGLQGQTQNQINANMNQWNYNQQLPYNQLSWYSSLLGQNAAPFGGSQSTATMPNNTGMSAGGGALAGAGTGAMMFPANPALGALGGAAVGGLMGLFH